MRINLPSLWSIYRNNLSYNVNTENEAKLIDIYSSFSQQNKQCKQVGTYLIEDPSAEQGLREVVNDENVPELKGLAVGHETRPDHPRDVRVAHTSDQRRHRRRHHGPVLHSGVYKHNTNISKHSGEITQIMKFVPTRNSRVKAIVDLKRDSHRYI